MRSQLRSCPIRRWLTLAACTFGISICFLSCSISADAGNEPTRTEPALHLQVVDGAGARWGGGAIRRAHSGWSRADVAPAPLMQPPAVPAMAGW
jgi:hypothetical protein